MNGPQSAATRRTRIVATLGPATDSKEMIGRLLLAGVNVFRLNFSHGDHDLHRQTVANIRAASEEFGIPVGILQDLQGPKIRVPRADPRLRAGAPEGRRALRPYYGRRQSR